MRRFQLFEFEDLGWFPSLFRNLMTDFLRTVVEKFGLFDPAIPILRDALNASGHRNIVDLASGGGGAWNVLLPSLLQTHPNLRLTLTDLYPNQDALSNLAEDFDAVDFLDEPVDARDVPQELAGIRTMFLSLHHLQSSDAVAVIRDAVDSGMPIAVFEAQQRDVEHLIRFALSPIMVLLITPWIRPFRFSRLVWTYVIPVLPLVVGWDGVVSVLRTYDDDERRAMADEADPNQTYQWRCATERHGQSRLSFLVGWPRKISVHEDKTV
ncbi:MAG: hypothetical protein ACR2NZ_10070 [Rubripirellula sp.]